MSSPLIAILRPIFRRARTSTHSLTLHPLSRSLTILAPGPSSSSDSSTVIVEGPGSGRDSQPVSSAASLGSAPDGQQSGATIDAAPQDGQTNHSGASQHPYANLRSSTTDGSSVMEDGLTSLDTPAITPDLLPTPHRPTPQHPFDTHAFVLHMEKSEFSPGVSRTLMYATKQLVNDRADRGRRNLLHKEDVENAAYLFKAALSELRTELSVRARNDGLTLRSTTSLIRREVDALSQKLKEDIGTLKHDIEMDMNNRKGDTRSDQKNFDISIEEINNKFTISLGDLRTEIEQAKWDATRRAIAIIAGVVFVVISVTTLTDSKASTPPSVVLPSPRMRDIGVGDGRLDDEDDALLNMRLKGLSGLGEEFVKDKVEGPAARGGGRFRI